MSQIITYRVDTIDGGITPTLYGQDTTTYAGGIGIDPDLTIDGGVTFKTSGAIVPVQYSSFSGNALNGAIVRMLTTPKTEYVYVITMYGKLIRYNNDLTNETEITTVFGSNCSGMEYYNNYLYISGTGTDKNDISRFGPLDGSPSMTNSWWTTIGKPALGHVTYPTTRQMPIPNHWMHAHGDDCLYICDYINGQGMLHKIKTKKVTVEGDTDDGSAYNVLDLPFGAQPTCIESYGTDLVVSTITGQSTVLNQGRSQLFLWDTFADSFYNQIPVTDPLITALYTNNNILYVFSGNIVSGFRVSRFVGGKSLDSIAFFEDGFPPFAGAVDSWGDRLSFGSCASYPETAACVYSYGSKDPRVPKVIHNTVRTQSQGVSPAVTAIRYFAQASNITPKIIAAWKDDSAYKIDKFGGNDVMNAFWLSRVFRVGKKYVIRKIQFPITAATSPAMAIQAAVYTDDYNGTIYTLPYTLSTTFPGHRNIVFKNPKPDGTNPITGWHNFILALRFAGGQIISVTFPILIEVEVFEDEQTR